ncbi:MAG: M48 family peptidase [Terriglobia bacterium]
MNERTRESRDGNGRTKPSGPTTEPQAGMLHPATELFHKAFRALRPRTPPPEIEVQFRPYADINNFIRVRDGRLVVGLSDMLEGAPPSVLEAIAFILVAKLYRKPVPKRYQLRYRQFLNRRSVRRQAHAVRRARGRKQLESPQGNHFHLEEIFGDLNQRFFGGQLERPQLSWSRATARALLGHYDPAHHAIVVSRLFDQPDVPRFLVEYLLYHEMLHIKHPVLHRRSRRCFHSAEFRAEEKQFPQYRDAKRLLAGL